MRSIFQENSYLPPKLGELPQTYQGWLVSWMWTSPATFYFSFMFFLSFALIMPSIVLLRRLAQSSGTIKTWVLEKLKISRGDRTKKPRTVWHNPIAWREARTKASAARASVLRYGFILLGIAGGGILLVRHSTEGTPRQYITSQSYNANDNSIYIDGATEADRLDPRITASSVIKLDDHDKAATELNSKYAVKSLTLAGKNAVGELDLVEFPRGAQFQ